ncbi:MAG: hypothetical protein MZW92_65540 [Comamonadaceae bacterium]|nr:hypothetical protein [Comamonadaceae bacterium]
MIQQHAEESAILRNVRSVLVRAPHVKLRHLARLDERIAGPSGRGRRGRRRRAKALHGGTGEPGRWRVVRRRGAGDRGARRRRTGQAVCCRHGGSGGKGAV